MQECSHPVSNYRTNSFWNSEPSAPGEPLCRYPAPFGGSVWRGDRRCERLRGSLSTMGSPGSSRTGSGLKGRVASAG